VYHITIDVSIHFNKGHTTDVVLSLLAPCTCKFLQVIINVILSARHICNVFIAMLMITLYQIVDEPR